MWTADRITIAIDEAEDSEMIVVIGTPSGVVRPAGAVRLSGGVLTIESAHVEGLAPSPPVLSGSPARLRLSMAGPISQPVTAIQAIKALGTSLREAHAAMECCCW